MRRSKAKVSLDPAFLVLPGFFALADREHLLLHILLAALVHECAHVGVLRLCGGEIAAFRLSPFGGELTIRDAQRLSYGRELLAVWAGPGSNLLCAVILSRLAVYLSWERGYVLSGIHMLLALFNLLPLRALDGGRLLYLCLCWIWEPITAERIVHAVTIFTLSVLLFFASLLLGTIGVHLPLLFAEVWFITCWCAETGIVKRRETG